MFVRSWNSRAVQPQPFRCLDSSAEAGALHSCLADGLDAAGRGTEAPAVAGNGSPCLRSIPAVVRVKKAAGSSCMPGEVTRSLLFMGGKRASQNAWYCSQADSIQ